MKRSEMADKLSGLLSDLADDLDNGSYEADAEILLDFLEENGMKPPSYQIFNNRTGAGGAVAATRVDNKWEPEDE